MGDEEPEAPAPEGEAEAEAEAAPGGVSVEDVQALAPSDAWERHPALKEAYEALEDKEGILAQAEAEEGEEAPAAAWGEKAAEFLEANKDKFAAAAAAEEKPKEPLKKVTKALSLADVAKLADEGAEARWEELEKLAGGGKALDKLSKEATNGLLDCTSPIDVIRFCATNREMWSKWGKQRMRKEQIRWGQVKDYYKWEKETGGPRWDFPEYGPETAIGTFVEDIAEERFEEQSKRGASALSHDVEIPASAKVKQLTYEAIVTRALSNRLTAKEVPSFNVSCSAYNAEGSSTFTVKHTVLDGEKDAILERSITAAKVHIDIKALSADLKKSKEHVSSAVVDSQAIAERGAVLKEAVKELADCDIGACVLALRDATNEPMKAITEMEKKLAEASSWAVFAEKVAGDAGKGKQEEYRKYLAQSLGKWIQAQTEAVVGAVESANTQLLEKSMSEANCSAETEALPVRGVEGAPAPEFLETEDAVKMLDILFLAQLEKSLGDSATAEKAADGDTCKWTVSLEMDV